jgi:hypothetical protein
LKNGDPDQEARPNPWFAQLTRHSEGKAKDLKRLWSGPSSQGDLLRRFHEIPALFWGIILGNIGKTIAMPRQQVGASMLMNMVLMIHVYQTLTRPDPKSDQACV